MARCYYLVTSISRSSCGQTDRALDSHATRPGSLLRGYGTFSTKLLSECRPECIKEECPLHVWKVGKGFLSPVRLKTS